MQVFFKCYQFAFIPVNLKKVPNQVPERVCLHYKALFDRRQFLPPLYDRRPEVSLMLMSNLPIPSLNSKSGRTYAKYIFSNRNLKAFVLEGLSYSRPFPPKLRCFQTQCTKFHLLSRQPRVTVRNILFTILK